MATHDEPDQIPVPFDAILLLAGSGSRLGAAVPKAFVTLAGQPLWTHAARALGATPGLRSLVLVVPPGHESSDHESSDHESSVAEHPQARGATVVPGGARRQDSVRAGLAALSGSGAAVVAVHDSARPLVSVDTILATVGEAARTGAALAAEPAWDTLKQVDADGVVVATPDRATLWHAETPQCFDRALLLRAHEASEADGVDATDDAMLVERLGHGVRVVAARERNFKVTRPDDLVMAQAVLARRNEIARRNEESEG